MIVAQPARMVDVVHPRCAASSLEIPRASRTRRRDSGEMYSPRRYFRNATLRATTCSHSISASRVSSPTNWGPAELALTIRPERSHGLARRVARARVARVDCGLALVWRGISVRNGRLKLRLGRRHKQHRRGPTPLGGRYLSRYPEWVDRPHPAGWARNRAEAWGLGRSES